MRKPALTREFDRFFTRLNDYTDLLLKLYVAREVVIAPEQAKEIDKRIRRAEKKHIHEAFVLKIYVAWEVLVENVFIECLRRRQTSRPRPEHEGRQAVCVKTSWRLQIAA